MTADYELHAAIQADLLDDAQRHIHRLRRALIDEVLEHAGFERRPDGSYYRPAGWAFLAFALPLSPDQARERLAAHGIDIPPFTEVPAKQEADQP